MWRGLPAIETLGQPKAEKLELPPVALREFCYPQFKKLPPHLGLLLNKNETQIHYVLCHIIPHSDCSCLHFL